jgi:hypothetical protein
MNRYLITLFLSTSLYALKVNITKDLPLVKLKYEGKEILIKRIQDTNHKLTNSFTKTSRPTPPFFIQPYSPINGVNTIEELEVLDALKNNSALLIDARLSKWYRSSTIPTALNIPFAMIYGQKIKVFGAKILNILKSRDLIIFDNGPWDQQAVALMRSLIKLNYPKNKIRYYRGGMQFWEIVGLTTIKPKQKRDSLTKLVDRDLQITKESAHTINIAGRQRMLTQLLSLNALALSFDPNAKNDLQEAIRVYDRSLNELEFGNKNSKLQMCKNKDTQKICSKVKTIWKPFKEELLKLLKNDGDIEYILRHNIELLNASNSLVQSLKKENEYNFLQEARMLLVDVAGRQRMLIVKMTKDRFSFDLNLDKEDAKKQLFDDITLFQNSLDDLIEGNPSKKIPKPANKEVINAYKKVAILWEKLSPVFSKDSLSINDLKELKIESKNLLNLMNEAVSVAEKVKEY